MPWRTDAGLTIDKEWQKAGMRNANGIPFSPLSSFTVESGAIGAGKEGGREREGGGWWVQCLHSGKNGISGGRVYFMQGLAVDTRSS